LARLVGGDAGVDVDADADLRRVRLRISSAATRVSTLARMLTTRSAVSRSSCACTRLKAASLRRATLTVGVPQAQP
jgi:hypothetical protein